MILGTVEIGVLIHIGQKNKINLGGCKNPPKKGINKMDKTIKRIEMLDKQSLEDILVKLVSMKNRHIVVKNTKALIDSEYSKALGEATLQI